jgi:hypothetical protein
MKQCVVIQLNYSCGVFTTIDNARSFTGVAQTAARTRSLYASFKGYYFHIEFLKLKVNFRSRPNRKAFDYIVGMAVFA